MEPPFATYTKFLFGVTTIPWGALPTGTVAMTLFSGSFVAKGPLDDSCAQAVIVAEATKAKASAATLVLTGTYHLILSGFFMLHLPHRHLLGGIRVTKRRRPR